MTHLKVTLLIFLGGGLGALLRFWILELDRRMTGAPFLSLGVGVANVLGCYLLGKLMNHPAYPNGHFGLFASVGLIGSLTTFSTYVAIAFRWAQNDRLFFAGAYLLSNIALGMLALYLGYRGLKVS